MKSPIKVVDEDPSADVETDIKDFREPSAHWLKLDEARLAHWKATIEGGDTVATLKAWAALLFVPRTRATASGQG